MSHLEYHKHPIHHEHQEQAEFFRVMFLLENLGDASAAVTFAVPNGAFYSGPKLVRVKLGRIMHAEGLRKGVPDILCAVAASGYHGLALELKTKGERPSPEQRAWHARLSDQGWKVVVCYGFEEALRAWALYVPSTPAIDEIKKVYNWLPAAAGEGSENGS